MWFPPYFYFRFGRISANWASFIAVSGRSLQVTVRPMLRDNSPVYPVCLSVTLLYCGQTVGWIRMPLRTEVGLGPGDIVLDGDPAPPRKGAQQSSPVIWPMSIVAKWSPVSTTVLSSCNTAHGRESLYFTM